MLLLPSSILWYQSVDSNALWLGMFGIALASRASWISVFYLRKGDEHPAYTPLRGMTLSTFIYCFLLSLIYIGFRLVSSCGLKTTVTEA